MISVTMAIQKDDINMSSLRILFDEVTVAVTKFDKDRKYLFPFSPIVRSPDFENGNVKIVDGKKSKLSSNESNACQKFEVLFEVQNASAYDGDFATQFLKNKRARCDRFNSYVVCKFLESTSNRIESLFLSAGLCYSELRQSMKYNSKNKCF